MSELDAVEQKKRDINFQITRALIIQVIPDDYGTNFLGTPHYPRGFIGCI
jgi:hypothetical protein